MRFSLLLIVLSLVLATAFLANEGFPNGLFSLKELGFYFTVCLTSLIVLITCLKCNYCPEFSFSPLEFAVFSFLVLIPCYQYLVLNVKFTNLVISIGAYIIFYSISIVGINFHWTRSGKIVFTVVLIAIVAQLILSIFQYIGWITAYHHASRVSGMFFNPGPYSIYITSLVMVILPILVLSAKNKKHISLLFLLTVFIIFIVINFELKSRSSWMGLAAGIFAITYIYLLKFKDSIRWRKNKTSWILIALLLISIPFVVRWLYQIRPESANGRMLIWKSTIGMIKDNFWNGVGIGNFAGRFPVYQATELQNQTTRSRYGMLAGETDYAFNDLLQIFADFGLFGGILYIFIIIGAFVRLVRFIKQKGYTNFRFMLGSGLMASLLVIIIGGLTSYPNQMLPTYIWFWTLIGLISLITSESSICNPSKPVSVMMLAMLSLGISLSFGYYYYKKTIAFDIWGKIKRGAINYGDNLQDLKYLDNEGELLNEIGHHFSGDGKSTLAKYYFETAKTCRFDKEDYYDLGFILERQGKYIEALDIYKLVEESIPYLLKPKVLQAKLLYLQGRKEEFAIKAREVLEMKPKVKSASNEQLKKEMRFLLKKLDD